MTVPWVPRPAPDNVRPRSWRIRLLVRLAPQHAESHSGFIDTILDTGALWTTFTHDHSPMIGVDDITSGLATRVRWFGRDHPAWQHRVRLTIAVKPDQSDTITLDVFDVLFIRQFPHGRSGRLVSLGVLGMDCVALLRLTLDGSTATTRF